jgi:hypothetical protein
MSDIINMNVQLLREKSLRGELSREECAMIVKGIRKERIQASEQSTAKKEKKVSAKKPAKSADDLLGELGI